MARTVPVLGDGGGRLAGGEEAVDVGLVDGGRHRSCSIETENAPLDSGFDDVGGSVLRSAPTALTFALGRGGAAVPTPRSHACTRHGKLRSRQMSGQSVVR